MSLLAVAGVATTVKGAPDGIPLRPLGKTGEKVSAIGLGGAHLGRGDADAATRVARTAIDRGITFMDNCWDYGKDGECEKRMGNALRDGYRQKVFLMTKFDGRTKDAAAKQIDESLARLQTDHIDLIQYHENIRMEDPDRFFAAGGALEAVLEAKKAGKVRYIGFTGHKDPAVHLRMLEVAAEHKFHFDSCQMPLSLMDYHFRSFGHQVLPKLVEQGIAPLAMKTLCRRGHYAKQHRQRHRVPALRVEPAGRGGDHRHGHPGTRRPGGGGHAHVQAHERGGGGRAGGQDQGRRHDREFRRVQDRRGLRRNRAQSAVVGVTGRANGGCMPHKAAGQPPGII